MARARHPKPEVEEALADIEAEVRIDVRQNRHVWAWMFCQCGKREHKFIVHGTPQNAGDHADRLRGRVASWRRQHEAERQKEERAQ